MLKFSFLSVAQVVGKATILRAVLYQMEKLKVYERSPATAGRIGDEIKTNRPA